MKVVGIIGSPRRNGHTATLVRAVLAGAAQHGADTEEIFLPDQNVEFCQGCLTCMARGKCVLTDDFEALRERVATADGLVLGSPNYGLTPSAMMKRFLERFGMFEFMSSAVLGGKYLVTVSASGGPGGEAVANYLAGLGANGIFQRAYISGRIAVAAGGPRAGESPVALRRATATGIRLARDIGSRRAYRFQNVWNRIVNRLIVRPKFAGMIRNGADGFARAVYENLLSRELIAPAKR